MAGSLAVIAPLRANGKPSGSVLDASWPAYLPQPALQRFSIPFCQARCRVVGALQKLHQSSIGVACGAHGVIGQKEFAEIPAEKCGLRLHARRAESIGRGICIGVERRIVDRPTAARPESGARNLVRICLLCDGIRQIGHPTRVTRCWTSRKARHSEIEASPKEVNRTRFAEKTSTEMRKNFLRR